MGSPMASLRGYQFGKLSRMLRRRASPILLAAVAAFCAAARAATPAVVAGPDYTLALSKDGKVFAWGRDARGQLGSGRTLVATSPQKVAAFPGLPAWPPRPASPPRCDRPATSWSGAPSRGNGA